MQVLFEKHTYQAGMDAAANAPRSRLFQRPMIPVEVGEDSGKEFIWKRNLVLTDIPFGCAWKTGKVAGKGLKSGCGRLLSGEKLPVYVLEKGIESAGGCTEEGEFVREIVLVVVQQPAFLQEVEKHQANKQAQSFKIAL